MGEESRLAAVVALAQGMAAAHSSREAWRAAAGRGPPGPRREFRRAVGVGAGARTAAGAVNVGELAEGEEEFPEDESYPVHQFAEITEFLHERWAGGGEPDAWVETAQGPEEGSAGYCHQRVAALRRRGRGCCVVAPIVLHGRAWGELYVARPVGEPVFGRADADFATVLAAVVAAGIAQTERLEEARRLALTDSLTGLANRRAVDARLDEAVELHRRDGAVVSLVVCDVNGLKRVNDTLGHSVGDRLLERFGTVLSLCGAMLPGALAARLGGDEFCLLAVGPSADEVVKAADEVCRRAVELDIGDGVACGVASTQDPIGPVRSARRLFRLADAAQYRAKAERAAHPVVAGREGPDDPVVRLADEPSGEADGERRRFRGRHAPGKGRGPGPVVTVRHSLRRLLNMDMHTVVVGTSGVTASDVLAVARDGARVELSEEAVAALAASREIVDALAAKPDPVYGVSTGFGALATRHISPDLRAQLQRNIVRSHAAGMGPRVEREVVRALMFLRLKTLCSGRTGVRPEVAQTMADVLNAGITPVVHEYGSLGCSGDLAPSRTAPRADGEGRRKAPTAACGRPATCSPPTASSRRTAREGGARPPQRHRRHARHAGHGPRRPGSAVPVRRRHRRPQPGGAARHRQGARPELHAVRPHPGQAASAANMLAVLKGSGLTGHHQDDAPRVQDAYSVRCAPQVAGAGRDTLAHARLVAERELAAAVDNPVVLPGGTSQAFGSGGGRVESNGNFHGAPVAYVLDFLAIAVADLASIAERRTDRLLDKNRSHGLPPFLADDPGVDSGLMIAQYTQAALVSELKRLAVPASADSIPSSAMQEDHVSMGWSAARKLRTAVDGLTRVVAVELYAATRAVELREGLTPAPATRAVLKALREAGVGGPGPDRYLAPDLAAAETFVRDGRLVEAVERVTGPLR